MERAAMIEPPIPGFTGVLWDARPAEKLAHDLTTGPGARPMADAGAAWSRIAVAFGAAMAEYPQIIGRLQEAWRSEGSGPVLGRIATLSHWLADAAAAASRNAALTGGQAIAYEVACAAMPDPADITELAAALRTVEQVGAALGAPLVGAVADIDTAQQAAKATAARVMHVYEAASAQLAVPWEQATPPGLVSAATPAAEDRPVPGARISGEMPGARPPGGGGGGGGGPRGLGGPGGGRGARGGPRRG
ncbi:PPE domain-containing protein, partial [Nocardia carnea]|uniref:PPE domain-containing protein n=1 Tax=Nocardia carnea TaxID=37328 RepID=UPI002458EAB5